MLPCFRQWLYPVTPRDNVTRHTIKRQLNQPEEYERRRAVQLYLGGETSLDPPLLRSVIRQFDVQGVAVVDHAVDQAHLAQLMQEEGLVMQDLDGYNLWVRIDTPERSP